MYTQGLLDLVHRSSYAQDVNHTNILCGIHARVNHSSLVKSFTGKCRNAIYLNNYLFFNYLLFGHLLRERALQKFQPS